MLKKIFPRHKVRPDQAGFIRRALAFGTDALLIAIISSVIYTGYSELRARFTGRPSPVSSTLKILEEGGSAAWSPEKGLETAPDKKQEYLNLLRGKIPEEEYRKASSMNADEIMKEYRHLLAASVAEQAGRKVVSRTETRPGDRTYKIIKEYIITLLYFVLFFRLKGQTPGKKLLGLKVIDLEGKPRLGWYQCFERAHGYVCSGLFASLGFWQVLWDRQGLTMHDRISSTTVIRLPSPPPVRKIKKSKEKLKEKEKTGDKR